jgi:branched-chain amino acid transport system substrate-binding protein
MSLFSTPRRRFALAALSAGVLALSACGGSNGGSGASSDTLKIGAIVPLTGPVSTLGPIADGIKAYFETVNANGGIDGINVEVVVKDDAYDPSKTPGQARALVEQEEVDMMCAPTGTGPTSAIYQYLTQHKIPTLALSGSPEFAGPETTVFQQLPDYHDLGAFVADFVVQDLEATNVAIAYSPDGVGEPFLEGGKAQLEKHGVTPTTVEFDPKSPDQSTVAAKLKDSGAEVVMVNHVAPIVSSIAKAAKQQGYEPQYVSTFALNDARFKEIAESSLDGVYLATPYLIGSEDVAAPYRDALAEHAPEVDPLDPVVMEGWATADVCHAVLENAVEAAGGKPLREEILDAMTDITVDTDYVPGLTWTADDHTGQKNSQITTFDGEKFVPFKPFTDFPES